MTDKNLDGSVIALHCNNQQELEQFLHTHLGELWSHKTQHCTTIAQSLMKQHINQIRNYSLQQMIHFIAHFEIRATIHTITSGDWDEAKYKTASKKEWNEYIAKCHIPKGISIKIWKAIQRYYAEPKHVVIDEEENKYYDPQMTPEPPTTHRSSNFSDWSYDAQELKLPTYISKALYYVSEDDVLELLIDQAVSKVLSFDDLWRDSTFCRELYDDVTFKNAVNKIYKRVRNKETQYDFIDHFIETEQGREILNYQRDVDKHTNDANAHEPLEEKERIMNNEMDQLQYQISRSKMNIESEYIRSCEYKIIITDTGFDQAYDWALFRRKTLKNVFMQTIKTSGYWKILTRSIDDTYHKQEEKADHIKEEENIEKEALTFYTTNLEHSMVSFMEDSGPITRDLSHLNAILLFLQTMRIHHLDSDDVDKIQFIPQNLRARDPKSIEELKPIVKIVFDEERRPLQESKELVDNEETAALRETARNLKKKKVEEEEEETVDVWYEIYWWNECKEDAKVHSLAMKHSLSKGKMEYFVRFVMPSTETSNDNWAFKSHDSTSSAMGGGDNKELLEWIWYDNNDANYKAYDLGVNVLKQLEASFHSNCSTIFPPQLNCNFNYLLLREMTAPLKNRGKNVGLGHVIRFTYSNCDVANIVNMEQLSVWKNAPQFARNIQRRLNGANSLFSYFSSHNSEYVNEWKKVYRLYTSDQEKFFWSHVLAVCAAAHYIRIERRNQIISFNYSPQPNNARNVVFAELHEQQQSCMDETHDAQAVVLEKFNTNVHYEKEDLPKQYCRHRTQWKWRNGEEQFYCDECASLLQFAEFVRKYILESEHPEVSRFLWPWYRNTLHRNDLIKYRNYVSKYKLSSLYEESDILGGGDYDETKSNKMRYRRKLAGRFLLGGWNISRNLNIIRQQLKMIFTLQDPPPQDSDDFIDQISAINGGMTNKYYDYECRSMTLRTPSQISYFGEFVVHCLSNVNYRGAVKLSPFVCWWLRTPKWYTAAHDVILLRLGLAYDLNEKEFVQNAAAAAADYEEFSAWCRRWQNILHRLRYVTHCIVLQLARCNPSIMDKRNDFGLKRTLNSVVFLDEMMANVHLRYCEDEKKSLQRDRDSDFGHHYEEEKKRDPFVVRSLKYEFCEILSSFDLEKHGKRMAQLIINLLAIKQRQSLWLLLGTLLKRIPYQMSFQILSANRDSLRRGGDATLLQLDAVCGEVCDGSNFSVAVALYLSSLMEVCAEEDMARHNEWKELSHKYEALAAQQMNAIECDDIVSILLDSQGLLEIALRTRRLHFLNCLRSVDDGDDDDYWHLFVLLLWKPFYFYLSPRGFSWTTACLFVLYCMIIGVYLSLDIHQNDAWQGIFEMTVWLCGAGYCVNVSNNNNILDIALSIELMILFALRVFVTTESYSNVYDILWAVQCILLSIRALRLFDFVLLRVIALMVATLVKFAIIFVILLIGFVVGLRYISTGDDVDEAVFSTLHHSSSYLLQLAVGITDLSIIDEFGRNHRIAQIYVSCFIVIASILLLNLLIALMATEFGAIRETARAESAYLKAQSCYDFQHRSRCMPPPLRCAAYVVVLAIHLVNFIPALLAPSLLNIYAHLPNPLQPKKKTTKNVMDTRRKVADYYLKWNGKEYNWKIFHLNCYNIISNATNDVEKWNVMTIQQYFDQKSTTTTTTIEKNLVTKCVFCKDCCRSITTAKPHQQLVTPFWVLADIVSVWCFLILLYLPMLMLLFVVAAAQRLFLFSLNRNIMLLVPDEQLDQEECNRLYDI
eukprot:333812_1